MKIIPKNIFLFFSKIAVVYFICSVILVLIFKWFDPPITSFIQSELNEKKLVSIMPVRVKQNWINLNEISSKVLLAVVASEDQKFFDHWGFDVDEIVKAVEEFEDKNKLRGASTLTQQVSKNLFLFPSKNFIRKGFEAYYTFLIELFWSKKRIIEVYLNIAELGPSTFGVSAGSRYHFHKPASDLNSDEAAYLAAILPNPGRYKSNERTNYINRRIEKIKRQMYLIGGEQLLKENL
ncbi:MAG: monofunctional biosynthetic peptidoglycan transglycosylase [Ignavibacteriae bacterium]|nr:monofunctional biosynthetic peptidoglycan transglycosylase [Ignavibacteriota bacterium]NOG96745.1 monofunctional biosynthetic peptidoglycan transglycosylase [Ignavibacteriota bacterium]